MTHTSQMQIPPGYFFKSAKQQYADVHTRLVIEVIQNSSDSGAKNIHLSFKDNSYEIVDNGCGMSAETMVDALLTFGGTFKENDATGGFGAAKELIIASMDSFTIHSGNTYVEGSGMSYTLTEIPEYRQGTRVTGVFPNGWDACAYNMEYYAKQFLKKCHLTARVYLNGVEFTNWKVAGRCCRETEWSKLHSRKVDYDNHYIFVRKNGLFMFERYLGDAFKKDVILEITSPSTEILTANRDGFRTDKGAEFDKLLAEIISDKNSFDRNRARKWVFKGIKSFISVAYEKLKEIQFAQPDVYALIQHVEKLAVEKNVSELNKIVADFKFPDAKVGEENVIEIVNRAIQHVKKEIQFDFIVDLGDSGLETIPKRLNPGTMAESNKTIAKLWRAALDTVFEANGMNASYRIGFTLNSDRIAQYSRVEGVEEFLINPDVPLWNKDKWEKIYELLTAATHEITHRNCNNHNEAFILTEEAILVKTLTHIKGDTNVITKRAKAALDTF